MNEQIDTPEMNFSTFNMHGANDNLKIQTVITCQWEAVTETSTNRGSRLICQSHVTSTTFIIHAFQCWNCFVFSASVGAITTCHADSKCSWQTMATWCTMRLYVVNTWACIASRSGICANVHPAKLVRIVRQRWRKNRLDLLRVVI